MNAYDERDGFALSVNARQDGTLVAAYIKLSDEPVAKTREIVPSVFMIDIDAEGHLVGLEFLAPTPMSVVMDLADQIENGDAFQRFVKTYAPRELFRPDARRRPLSRPEGGCHPARD